MVSETEKPRLSISFSGGRSSAVMTKILIEKMADSHEIIVTFANTGCEHEGTLQFVHNCDRIWNFNTVWLEAVIVTFETASRNGEPFEAAIKKHGIFNPANPNCTNRLKIEVMESYLKSLGWRGGEYTTAIGIRADEIDRVSPRAKALGVIYPLVDLGIGKPQVIAMMRNSEFDLHLPGEHYGNCVWCWKKTQRKLMTVAKHTPEVFDFPKRMEELHGSVKTDRMDSSVYGESRTFFRNGLSANDICQLAMVSDFKEYKESNQRSFPFWEDSWDELDIGGGCGDSCEVYADEK